jgi:uncharacterized protein YggU (UPF0235/DUF167 family)
MSLWQITQSGDGVRFSVKARTAARVNEIRAVHNGCLVVTVTAAAEKGRANEAIIKLLAARLGIAKRRVSIVAGAASSTKSILVTSIDAPAVRARLLEQAATRPTRNKPGGGNR